MGGVGSRSGMISFVLHVKIRRGGLVGAEMRVFGFNFFRICPLIVNTTEYYGSNRLN